MSRKPSCGYINFKTIFVKLSWHTCCPLSGSMHEYVLYIVQQITVNSCYIPEHCEQLDLLYTWTLWAAWPVIYLNTVNSLICYIPEHCEQLDLLICYIPIHCEQLDLLYTWTLWTAWYVIYLNTVNSLIYFIWTLRTAWSVLPEHCEQLNLWYTWTIWTAWSVNLFYT